MHALCYFLRNYYAAIGFVLFRAEFLEVDDITLIHPKHTRCYGSRHRCRRNHRFILDEYENNNNNDHPYCERVGVSTCPLPNHQYRSMMIHPG
mmetsp:Transcript_61635/g.69032  ORF Transcript_61635/g.69032 Transcript_61635/m.69032 type:complete len:93 (-) Transcript_61635:19-297(-)